MAKRSDFIKRDRGFYPTPIEAVQPLIPHLPGIFTPYAEPCAGDGALIRALRTLWPDGWCAYAADVSPQDQDMIRADAMTATLPRVDLIVTNPPWPLGGRNGDPALGLLKKWIPVAPTWALLSWDFAANAYFNEVRPWCHGVLPIGRVSWEGNGVPGKDNAAWYGFRPVRGDGPRILERIST